MQSQQQVSVQNKVHRYKCPGCGAELVFAPVNGALSCEYCGRVEQIPDSSDKVEERSYQDYLSRPQQLSRLADNAIEVRCNSCGSTVEFTPPDVAGECAFCGMKIVAQPKAADPLIAPEAVLPFKLAQPQASAAIKQWLSSRWFAPNSLKRIANEDTISGVYLPFWTYDSHTVSHYSGERGDAYYRTEHYTETDQQGNQVQKTRQVREISWHHASGTVSRWFDDVVIPATKSVSNEYLSALEPWDLENLKPYDPAYLPGFKAQRYQVELAQGFEAAKTVMGGQIHSDVRSDIGGDEQRVHNVSTAYSAITFKHILLPVYLAAYRHSDKVYQVMINARTGEVQGERPYSFWKIFFLVVGIIGALLFFFLILILANAGSSN